MKKRISILGSTGSVGAQCREVIEENLHEFEIITLTAGSKEE